MMIPIPIGRMHEATITASAIRVVRCESCGGEFVYQLKREVSAMGFSPLWLNERGAGRRAQEAARERIDAAMERAVDVVACPTCGWYQKQMVQVAKLRRFWWTLGVGLALAVALWVMSETGQPKPKAHRYFCGAVALAIATGIGAPVWYYTHNPNRNSDESVRAKRALKSKAMTRAQFEEVRWAYEQWKARGGSYP